MKAQEAEEHDIKKMQEQVAETAQIIPTCRVKIEGCLEDLKNFMTDHEEDNEMKEAEEWKLAEQTLAEVTAFVETF